MFISKDGVNNLNTIRLGTGFFFLSRNCLAFWEKVFFPLVQSRDIQKNSNGIDKNEELTATRICLPRDLCSVPARTCKFIVT